MPAHAAKQKKAIFVDGLERSMFRTQPRTVTVPKPGPARYHEVFGTSGPNDLASLASVDSFETYLPLWRRIESKGEAGVRITGEPFSWTDDGTTYLSEPEPCLIYSFLVAPFHSPLFFHSSSCAAFDCNMWAAHRAATGYNAAMRASELGNPAAVIGTQVRPAVEAINFLLEGGALARDRSIALVKELTPPSLEQTRLREMRNALIATAWKKSADTHRDSLVAAEQALRAAWLTKSVESAEKAPGLVPKGWTYSRKVEAVAANGEVHALQCDTKPDIEGCRKTIGAFAGAAAGIGLGFQNYSDVKKADVQKKLQTAQNDLTLV